MRNIQRHKDGNSEAIKGKDSSYLLLLNTGTEYVCTYHSIALFSSMVLKIGESGRERN